MFIGLTTSCETMSIEITDSTSYMKKPIIFPILTFKGFAICIFEYGHFGFVVRFGDVIDMVITLKIIILIESLLICLLFVLIKV